MSEIKFNGFNSRLKRTTEEDRTYKDEPPFKSQRLLLPSNDDYFSQGPAIDSQYENSEITEHNYKKIPATTLYKKLQVLECRDRILRAATSQSVKEVNVDKIKPMEGTCQDMCPEKERLLRIHGNMVSSFEYRAIDSRPEPMFDIMVKQYARSSADQANPLSHELRPTPVLVKTMNYMLKNIIHPIESNVDQDLASWYDFCWDRLRAIRKDIVQQHLQNSEVVTILEQIGRFHIACYDLMLGYPGFDIKLNTENLNNCIQMLMPMYRDSDEQYPNQAEFVSYELLMHLGNPQFHTAYDLLPNRIKQSPQVRFCIEAHLTYLQSSDCIEFFNLLRNTTFMNCCILQRVIPSIRFNCIKMMNMSYASVKRTYKLEIEHIMSNLCFDNIQLAQEFCSDVRLKCDGSYVVFSRKITISPPEDRRQRQEFVITEKRQNLTFLISGLKCLPDVEINSVHSSFDGYDYFYDPVKNELIDGLNNEIPDSLMDTSAPNSKDNSQFSQHVQPFSTTPIQKTIFNKAVPNYTFKLPKFSQPSQVQSTFSNLNVPWIPSIKPTTPHCDVPSFSQSDLATSTFSAVDNNLKKTPMTPKHDLFVKPSSESSMRLGSFTPSPKIHFKEKIHLTQLMDTQMILARKYFCKWQNYINLKKSRCIEEMFSHSVLFYSECISSLSSSQSSVKSMDSIYNYNLNEESKEWQHKQLLLAEKYFYIWLRKVLRKRRKFEIDPVSSLPWSVFMQVHGTPKETLLSMGTSSKKKKAEKKCYSIPLNRTIVDDDICDQMANMFVKNVLDTNKIKPIGKKLFWKLAVNYGSTLEPNYMMPKVQTIIYGKVGLSNKEIQTVFTDYNTLFIKSVESRCGLFNWTKSGVNAALIFTNTQKEDMETLFKRVDILLQSTPIAIPLVMIFSSSSNKDEIENYQSVLDAYRENDYINNYSVYMWEGPKTILEAIEFFSKHYVDTVPGVRSEKLYYNLLNFAQSFFLKVRNLLPDNNPNIIIEKYNQYLDVYIKRLGKDNLVLGDMAPEFLPLCTQSADEFSEKYSNLNLKYFESLLNDAHLLQYESWPPQNVNNLIDYVKNMCQLTNRRCWCLDILQMLQLHRKADLDYCLLNASWYEAIEMWIEGALEKCSVESNNFTVFYNNNPIEDGLKIVFPDS